MTAVLHRGRVLACVVAVVAIVAGGCSSSSSNASSDKPTTSFHYLVNPLEPGHGYVQLGENRYPFDGVICATGAVKSDPAETTRIFGVYANFRVDGKLAAVSLTRYRSDVKAKIETRPTITDTAMIRMQGDDEVLGLKAQRARVIGQSSWGDVNDPTATGPLITKEGDRYEAKGQFGPTDGAPANPSGGAKGTAGQIAARCPSAKGGPTTTTGAESSEIPPEVTGPSPSATDGTDQRSGSPSGS